MDKYITRYWILGPLALLVIHISTPLSIIPWLYVSDLGELSVNPQKERIVVALGISFTVILTTGVLAFTWALIERAQSRGLLAMALLTMYLLLSLAEYLLFMNILEVNSFYVFMTPSAALHYHYGLSSEGVWSSFPFVFLLHLIIPVLFLLVVQLRLMFRKPYQSNHSNY